MFTAEFSLNTD